jgi:hypothetical protein
VISPWKLSEKRMLAGGRIVSLAEAGDDGFFDGGVK